MSTIIIHFFLGPLILLIALITKFFPPKKINHLYGYRTSRSMKSQKAWDCANAYAANVMVVTSVIICLFQFVVYILLGGNQSVLWSVGFLTVAVIAVIPITEIHLRKRGH
jgi:uncharacterized membrane protein